MGDMPGKPVHKKPDITDLQPHITPKSALLTQGAHLTAFLFIIYLAFFFLTNLISGDRAFSEFENRTLSQIPDFTVKSLISGDYTDRYEEYISDQFILRDMWVSVKAGIERATGKKENNGVYIGKDGQLFQIFRGTGEDILNKRAEAISDFTGYVNGVSSVYCMLVPNSSEIMKDKLPAFAEPPPQKYYIEKIRSAAGPSVLFVDVYEKLSAAYNSGGYIFYRTDHHWTTHGAWLAYTELASAMGFVPFPEDHYEISGSPGFYGVLHSKCGLGGLTPDILEIYRTDDQPQSLYNMDYRFRKDKYSIFPAANQALISFETNSPDKRKLLIIKDSFANCLIPFLTEHFNEITVADLRYYNGSIAELALENDMDDILILYNVITFLEESSAERLSWEP